MSRYRKYTDNYAAMLAALKIPLIYKNRTEAKRKQEYIDDIYKDKDRATVVELRPGHLAATTENLIYSPEHYQKNPYYSQGVYDGRSFYFTLESNPTFFEEINTAAQRDDQNYVNKWGFPYIDEEGIDCSLSVTRFGHEPSARYMVTLMRHITDADDRREVQLICSEPIAQDAYYTNLQGQHQETPVESNQILPLMTSEIRSPQIAQLFASIFDENGEISEQKFEHFKTRLSRYNIDNRDILHPQFTRILACLQQVNPQLAHQTQQTYANDPINFFEYEHYKQFLTDLLQTVQRRQRTHPEVYAELQALCLEFLMVDFVYVKNGTGQEFVRGLPTDQLTSLQENYLNILPTHTILDEAHFQQIAEQCYRQVYFDKLLRNCAQFAHIAAEPIRSFADAHLTRLTQFKLSTLSLSKQHTLIEFTKSLKEFTSNQTAGTLSSLEKLYKKVHLNVADLGSVKQSMITHKMSELSTNIDQCQHPYIKEEAEKKLRYMKNIDFHAQSPQKQALLITFIEKLNQYTASPRPNTLQELAQLYEQLDLIPIDAQKSQKLSLSPELARVYHSIEHHQYTIDPQGRVLVTSFDSPHSTEPTIWNLAMNEIEIENEVAAEFYDTLSTELKKQTQAFAPLMDLYEKNKKFIYPLQQAVQTYLSEVAQICQSKLHADGLSSEIMQTALHRTAALINKKVIGYLAVSLVRAGIHRGHVSKQLDMQTLNHLVGEKQDRLRKFAYQTLVTQIQLHMRPHDPNVPMSPSNSEKPIQENIVYCDRQQNLITKITTVPVACDYTCEQIQTLRQTSSTAKPTAIMRTRIHSNALQPLENMSPADYQHQFQTRLEQLTETFQMQYPKPLTYYLYAATAPQIQQTIQAMHRYNWQAILKNANDNLNLPLCWIQTYSKAEPGTTLGYSALDWDGAVSDLTLMHEMSLCTQIATIDAQQTLDLQPYANFLDPNQSLFTRLMKTSVFAFSKEGKQVRSQIETLKEQWRTEANLAEDLGNQTFTTKALQKLIGFDLHYDPEYAILVQTMSLAISKQTLLHDATDGTVLADTLGQAQIFDLLPLPDSIKGPFLALIRSIDKQTAITSARLLKQAMQHYCAKNQDAILVAAMLPITAQQTQATQTTTAPRAIEQLRTHLITPIEKPVSSHPKTHTTEKSISRNPARSSQKKRSSPSIAEQPDRLFARTSQRRSTSPERQPESLLSNAAKNKAQAYRDKK